MTDKNFKVLERLAFVAGVKIEDLKAAILSLSIEPEVKVSDIDIATLKVDKLSDERRERFYEELKELGNQIRVAQSYIGPPSPLSIESGRLSHSRETIIKIAIEYLSADFYDTYPLYYVDFEKRTVVCLLKRAADDKIVSKGIAKCNPDDCFNEHIGKVIALYRAEGLKVPEYFLNVPQPDHNDIRKGDVAKFGKWHVEYTVIDPDKTTDNLTYVNHQGETSIAHSNLKGRHMDDWKIINDTGRY